MRDSARSSHLPDYQDQVKSFPCSPSGFFQVTKPSPEESRSSVACFKGVVPSDGVGVRLIDQQQAADFQYFTWEHRPPCAIQQEAHTCPIIRTK